MFSPGGVIESDASGDGKTEFLGGMLSLTD